MMENLGSEEIDLVDAATAWLQERLPDTWQITRRSQSDGQEPSELDDAIDLRGPSGTFTTVAVEAKGSLDPRGAEELLPRLARVVQSIAGNIPVLVVAPWLSPRTREVLEREKLNYIDLTGNALISLDNPTLYIRSDGAARNPLRRPTARPSVRGPKAARLIRLLADVRPPYGVTELAKATRLAPGYVSRLLATLDREALIERTSRGVVTSVNFPGLLRRWAESYDVIQTNDATTFVAPNGAATALTRILDGGLGDRVAVTGSFAAMQFAPVSASALLLVYCVDVQEIRRTAGLLPATEGVNAVLLRPFDEVVWERTVTQRDMRIVAASQIVVDCLTGPGRMPAEGEALLTWMQASEGAWRRDSVNGTGISGDSG